DDDVAATTKGGTRRGHFVVDVARGDSPRHFETLDALEGLRRPIDGLAGDQAEDGVRDVGEPVAERAGTRVALDATQELIGNFLTYRVQDGVWLTHHPTQRVIAQNAPRRGRRPSEG